MRWPVSHLLPTYVLSTKSAYLYTFVFETFGADATGLALEAGTLHFGLAISLLTGKSTITVNDSPLTKSSSPSDFWGGRWNKQIHGLLKVNIVFLCGLKRL